MQAKYTNVKYESQRNEIKYGNRNSTQGKAAITVTSSSAVVTVVAHQIEEHYRGTKNRIAVARSSTNDR